MLNFEEMKDAASEEDGEAFDASKSDLIPLDSFLEMPEKATIRVFDNYFPETELWREGEQIVAEITEHKLAPLWNKIIFLAAALGSRSRRPLSSTPWPRNQTRTNKAAPESNTARSKRSLVRLFMPSGRPSQITRNRKRRPSCRLS